MSRRFTRALAEFVVGLGLPLLTHSGAARAEPPVTETVTVRGVRFPRGLGSQAESAREAASRAGSLGDASRAVETAAGVGRAGPSGAFIAWGSSGEESSFLVDGVPVPFLFHGGGVRGALPTAELATVRVVPGAFGAEYGRATGGLVLLTTAAPEFHRTTVRARADLLDVGGRVSVARLAPRPVSASVGFRMGIASAWLGAASGGDLSPFVVPDYRDAQARAALELEDGGRVSLTYLGAEDAWVRQGLPAGSRPAANEHWDQGFHRVSATYEKASSDRASGALAEIDTRTKVTPFFGVDHRFKSAQSGPRGDSSAVSDLVYGLRASHALRFGPRAELSLGVDALGRSSDVTRDGTLTLPPREGDPYAFGVTPAAEWARDAYQTHLLEFSLYAELGWSLGPLSVVPGVRFTTSLVETSALRPPSGAPPSGSTELSVSPDPRIAARLALGSGVALVGSFGTYVRAPVPSDLSAVFGNPTLPPSRATHALLGFTAQLSEHASWELLGFHKTLSDLAVRTSSLSPAVAQALQSSGRGLVFGTQTSVRVRNLCGFSGLLAWTISRSERQASAGASSRPADFDQPHVVTMVLERAFGPWLPSVRARFASGAPRTPVSGSSENLSSGGYEPAFGPVNSARLPDFFQLDARLERAFPVGPKGSLKVAVEALNLTAHENAEEFLYTEAFAPAGTLQGLPPFFNLSLEVEP